MKAQGTPIDGLNDDQIRRAVHQFQLDFRDKAPLSAEAAATIILDGVREGRWRILVGDDALALDASVREDPESAYEPDFIARLASGGHFQGMTR